MSQQRTRLAAEVLHEAGGAEVISLDMRPVAPGMTDTFLIATGQTTAHLKEMADRLRKTFKRAGELPHHTEGEGTGWLLLDYGDLVVHLMDRKHREYYDIEGLWNDAARKDYE